MAEENAKVTTNDTTEVVTEETVETNTDADVANKAPTVEELLAKLAQAESEKKILKASNDKLSKESAESKRALRAKMTEAALVLTDNSYSFERLKLGAQSE